MTINVKKLSNDAIIPTYAHEDDAGLDLFANETLVIKPNETKLVKTGISIELPVGYEAQIRPRSGLALKNSVTVLNTPGTIDSGYRGEIGIILINHSSRDFEVEKGMKVAQMVIASYVHADFNEVDVLTDSMRGEGGFGSTGMK